MATSKSANTLTGKGKVMPGWSLLDIQNFPIPGDDDAASLAPANPKLQLMTKPSTIKAKPGYKPAAATKDNQKSKKTTGKAGKKRGHDDFSDDESDSGDGSASQKHKKPKPKAPAPRKLTGTPSSLRKFIEDLQQRHADGEDITPLITCTKCNQVLVDVRVPRCHHLYCFKCVMELRKQATKGNVETGFKPFCIKPDCKVELSGKTSILERCEAQLLAWFQAQDAGTVTNVAARYKLFELMKERYDDGDGKFQTKLDELAVAQKRKESASVEAREAERACFDLLEVLCIADC